MPAAESKLMDRNIDRYSAPLYNRRPFYEQSKLRRELDRNAATRIIVISSFKFRFIGFQIIAR